MLQNALSHLGERSAAALGASGRRFDQRLLPAAVHRIDQKPRPPVAHVHDPGRSRDGTVVRDGVEKIGLAGSHCDLVPAVELDLDLQGLHDVQVIRLCRTLATCFGGN